jgi:hypothetical protein
MAAARERSYAIRLGMVGAGGVITSFKQVGDAGKGALTTVETSSQKAGAQLAAFGTQIKQYKGALLGLATAVTGGFSFAAIKSATAYANTIQDIATQSGFAAEALQVMRFAGEQNGIALEAVDKALITFSRGVGEAARGGGELKNILDGANVSLRDGRGELRNVNDILRDFVDGLKKARSDQERAAMASKAFGEEGGALIRVLRDGSGAIDQMAEKAGRLGRVISNEVIAEAATLNTEIDTLAASLRNNFQRGVLDGLTGGMKSVSDTITDPAFQAAVRGLGDTLGGLLRFMVEHKDEVEAVMAGLGAAKFIPGPPQVKLGTGLVVGGGTYVYSQLSQPEATADELRQQLEVATSERNQLQAELNDRGIRASADIPNLPGTDGFNASAVWQRVGILEDEIAGLQARLAAVTPSVERGAQNGMSPLPLPPPSPPPPPPPPRTTEKIMPLPVPAPRAAAPADPAAPLPNPPAGPAREEWGKALDREIAQLNEITTTEKERNDIERERVSLLHEQGYVSDDVFARRITQLDAEAARLSGVGALLGDIGQEAARGFVDWARGADTAADAVRRLEDAIASMILQKFVADPLGDLFGAAASSWGASIGKAWGEARLSSAATNVGAMVAVHHTGGVVGGGYSGGRMLAIDHPFAAAPRYHSGGIAGLAPDERPAILRLQEEVLTRDDPRHRYNGGGAAGTSVSVNQYNTWNGSTDRAQVEAMLAQQRAAIMAAVPDAVGKARQSGQMRKYGL